MDFFKNVKESLSIIKRLFYELYCTAVYYLLVRNTETSIPSGIIFVCHGNICRSAFAHEYVLQKKSLLPISTTLMFSSYGIKAIQNNTSPDNAITAAQLWGIDLTRHRAKVLRKEEVGNDDWLIGMDFSHFIQLRKIFRECKGKNIFLLRHFGRKPFEPVNIQDPYGKSEKTFKGCFLLIQKHVSCLIAQLDKKQITINS